MLQHGTQTKHFFAVLGGKSESPAALKTGTLCSVTARNICLKLHYIGDYGAISFSNVDTPNSVMAHSNTCTLHAPEYVTPLICFEAGELIFPSDLQSPILGAVCCQVIFSRLTYDTFHSVL